MRYAIKTRFFKKSSFSYITVAFVGNGLILPSRAKTKKEAMPDVKKELQRMVDKL